NVGSKRLDRRDRAFDLAPDLRRWSELRCSKPIMAYHSLLIRIGDRTALELCHCAESGLHRWLHPIEEAFVERHVRVVEHEINRRNKANSLPELLPPNAHFSFLASGRKAPNLIDLC